jgi:hypothetical protein
MLCIFCSPIESYAYIGLNGEKSLKNLDSVPMHSFFFESPSKPQQDCCICTFSNSCFPRTPFFSVTFSPWGRNQSFSQVSIYPKQLLANLRAGIPASNAMLCEFVPQYLDHLMYRSAPIDTTDSFLECWTI